MQVIRAHRLLIGAVLASVSAGAVTLVQDETPQQQTAPSATQLPIEGEVPSLSGAREWINSAPLTTTSLRDKVVLIDFWTYTCINWRRTLPYLRAWAEKYKDHGLVVIGVHTPEFSFEKEATNVHRAMNGLEIHYPVAVDSDYLIWRAFGNQYWPAIYIADHEGRIRYHQFGEGDYDQTESVIQQLLAAAGNGEPAHELVSLDPEGVEAAADWASLKSPEAYVGYERAEYFISPGGVASDRPRAYTVPSQLRLNEWGLVGNWTIGAEAATLVGSTGRVVYRFHARDLNLIMGPATRGGPVRFRVRIDGKAPGGAHGIDVDEQGNGTVAEPRMYQLIRQPAPIADRVFDIEFLGSGVAIFDFTFG